MVRPLTRRKREGVLYVRPSAIEAEIDDAVSNEPAVLQRRLRITGREERGYLRPETLVHLVRRAFREGDERCGEAVLAVLLRRCEVMLRIAVSSGMPNAESLREEILSEFSELLASDGHGDQPDELDIYECCFNLAFRTLRIDRVRREIRLANKVARLPEGEDLSDVEPDEDAFAKVSEAFRTPATQENTLFLDDVWTAINALKPDERRAVILVHVFGYDEESKSPTKVTAATLCGCDGRTIRNRLSRAAKKLAGLKEEA